MIILINFNTKYIYIDIYYLEICIRVKYNTMTILPSVGNSAQQILLTRSVKEYVTQFSF